MELSSDTEDSTSETSEQQSSGPLKHMEDLLKGCDTTLRKKILQFCKKLIDERNYLAEQCENKDNVIKNLMDGNQNQEGNTERTMEVNGNEKVEQEEMENDNELFKTAVEIETDKNISVGTDSSGDVEIEGKEVVASASEKSVPE